MSVCVLVVVIAILVVAASPFRLIRTRRGKEKQKC